jgi:hypothetical protein
MSRNPKGSSSLSDDQVKQLRLTYKEIMDMKALANLRHINLAKDHNISQETLRKIALGKTYEWVK